MGFFGDNMTLKDDIRNIKGVGEKTAAAFSKLNIHNIEQLIHTFPKNYLSYDEPVKISELSEGYRQAVYATVTSYVTVRQVRNLKISTVTISDGSGNMRITWFNSPYIKNVIKKGDYYVFVGEVKNKNNMLVMEMPEYYKMTKYKEIMQEMQPIYSLTAGLSNTVFKKAIKEVRGLICQKEDYLPQEIRDEYMLMELSEAYENIHFPMNREVLINAIKRMAFDEFYSYLTDMNKIKDKNLSLPNRHIVVKGREVAEFVNSLPYTLTKGQQEAIEDILKDMGSDTVMNRLVQGDVGSGKTIVAATALYACALTGYQCALMVPTEVLAKQHFREMSELLGRYGINVRILVGSTPLKEKREIYEQLKNGDIDVIIGTHALIEDKVEFKELGLVITDEQHRFGVNQRKKLSEKGDMTHTLVMSATPIPRTLAMIMYADLDISIINELPRGRKPIKNCVVGTNYRETAHKFIASRVREKEQAYIICPMVGESETVDAENVIEYSNALSDYFGNDIKVGTLHGQMKAEHKNEIMQMFLEGDIDVLVSTTVIEVGINNPKATVMLIENAERFGLAQLHQLRGRVGRGKLQSYCILICGKQNEESMERLRVLENSNDGFYIAGEDLKLRGPGDFFGIRQSGEALFKIADIYNHSDVLKKAQDILKKYGELKHSGTTETDYISPTL